MDLFEGPPRRFPESTAGKLPRLRPTPMQPSVAPFRRPELPTNEYFDEHGDPIPYGRRWPDGPPEDAYSRVTHPERFAPLHAVADALADYLVAEYDVRRDDLADPASAFRMHGVRLLRAIRLTPGDPDAAPLVLGFTDYPGVVVHAGVRAEEPFPVCGCDACDDDLARVADELERFVLAVASGAFAERIADGEYEVAQVALDGVSGGSSRSPLDAPDPAAEARLAELPDGWHPWPERPAPHPA